MRVHQTVKKFVSNCSFSPFKLKWVRGLNWRSRERGCPRFFLLLLILSRTNKMQAKKESRVMLCCCLHAIAAYSSEWPWMRETLLGFFLLLPLGQTTRTALFASQTTFPAEQDAKKKERKGRLYCNFTSCGAWSKLHIKRQWKSTSLSEIR